MKHNQKGFGAIEALLILVVVGIVGGTGYFVLNSKNDTDKLLTADSSSSPRLDKSAKSGDSQSKPSLSDEVPVVFMLIEANDTPAARKALQEKLVSPIKQYFKSKLASIKIEDTDEYSEEKYSVELIFKDSSYQMYMYGSKKHGLQKWEPEQPEEGR
jgi:hypothetical protein